MVTARPWTKKPPELLTTCSEEAFDQQPPICAAANGDDQARAAANVAAQLDEHAAAGLRRVQPGAVTDGSLQLQVDLLGNARAGGPLGFAQLARETEAQGCLRS